MKTENLDRGYYFQVSKQDVLKKDLWTKEAIVFAISALSAAEIFIDAFCQESDYLCALTEISMEEYDFLVRGDHSYECKYKLTRERELDFEVPAYLRN